MARAAPRSRSKPAPTCRWASTARSPDGFLQACMASVNLPRRRRRSTPRRSCRARARSRSVARRSRRPAATRSGSTSARTCSSNRRWRELGLDMRFAPDAVVRWRLRPTLRATWTQYFRYARGDALAGMFPERHALRFGVYAGGTAALASRTALAEGARGGGRGRVRAGARPPGVAAHAGPARADRGGGRRARVDGLDRLREDDRLRGRAGRSRTRGSMTCAAR